MKSKIVTRLVVGCVLLCICFSCATKKATPMEMGVSNFESRDYDAAKSHFETVLMGDQENAQATYYLGRIALESGDHDSAIKHLEKAVNIDAGNSEYHFRLGVAYAQKIQKVDDFMQKGQLAPKLKNEFEKAVETDPENLDARSALAQYYLNAPPIVGGSTEKAMEQVQQIKKRDPLRGHTLMALIHQQNKDFEAARAEMEAAVKLDPKDPDVYYQFGMLYQAQEDYTSAFEALEKALAVDPGYTGALYQIGRTAVFSGTNLDRAVECLKLYLKNKPGENQPTWAHAHWRLGMVYEKMENIDLAIKEYKAALEIDPSIKGASEALEKLQAQTD